MKGLLRFSHRAVCTLSNRQVAATGSNKPSFGLLFDIDGVLVRGKMPIPAAKKAFQKLVNNQGQFRLPVVFVTNAGYCLRQEKADQLSHILGVPIPQDQVVMSYSPLRMFKKYHEKCVLVSGQGAVEDIAKNLGFENVVNIQSIEMLRKPLPLPDLVDQETQTPSTPVGNLPKIEAVILFGELFTGANHGANLQLIVDILLTNGNLSSLHQPQTFPHLPLLACDVDLMWMSEAQSPRLAHGAFLLCLENIYKKITGQEVRYEALMGKPSVLTYRFCEFLIRSQAVERGWTHPITSLYAIGDNPTTDIYGANLYNRHLVEQAATAAGSSATVLPRGEEEAWESELGAPAATSCKSVLVCTGVYNPDAGVPSDASHSIKETVFHGHRDFRFEPALVEPSHLVHDVAEAVDLIFQQEKFVP